MTFIKFCGMTREEDVQLACELGVNAVGFILWPGSPRYVEPKRAVSLVRSTAPSVIPVGVVVSPTWDDVDRARDAGVRVVQVHGELTHLEAEPSPDGTLEFWVARSLDADVDAIPIGITVVLDAHDPQRYGGTGRTIDWTRAATIAARRRVLLAGGLTPDNVGAAIHTVGAFGIDVASGIEARPGIKSRTAMTQFVAAVREAAR